MTILQAVAGGLAVFFQLVMLAMFGGVFISRANVRQLTKDGEFEAAYRVRDEQRTAAMAFFVLFGVQWLLMRLAGDQWTPITIDFGDFA